VAGKWWFHLLRIGLGLACMMALYAGIQLLSPGESNLVLYSIWRLSGFLLISFSAVFLLPLLFIRLKLLEPYH
jgi:uncharacterized protein HemY